MSAQLRIGGILFSEMDQTDFTAPFEVLSRVPDSRFFVIAKTLEPIRDMKGLILTPEVSFADAPQLDVLLVPGGGGVNALMEDPVTLDFIRRQAATAKLVLTVCTGSLLFGAAGLLKGRRATTHWASRHLLLRLGATLEKERVVRDGNLITTAGVTAGMDGALLAASILCDRQTAEGIQLYMEYAPDPPFQSGSPETAPAQVLEKVKSDYAAVVKAREEIVQRITKSWEM